MRARMPLGGLITISSVIVLGGWVTTSTAAQADSTGNGTGDTAVCQPQGDHLSTPNGSTRSVTYTAPDGFLVSGYCVKAGSTQQGNGPVNVVVDPPAASVTIAHPSGKEISHYTVTLVPVPKATATPTTSVTPTPNTVPSATPSSAPTTAPSMGATQSPTATPTPTVLGVQAEVSTELDTSTASDDDKPDEQAPEVEVKGVQATKGHVTVPTVIDAGR